ADIHAVTGCCLPVDVDVDVITAGDPFGNHIGRAVDRFEDRLGLNRQILEHIQVITEDLDPQVGTHSGGEHVDAVDDRLGPAVAYADLAQLVVQLGHDVGLFHARSPFVLGFQND